MSAIISLASSTTENKQNSSLEVEGLEIEMEDPSEIKQPFDPEKIKVRTVNVVVDQIVSRLKYNEIDLAPNFQRKAGIWDKKRQSRLIESILLRIPIPVFYVAADKNERWSVVDGLQRTSAINDYATGKFRLTNLEYLVNLNNCYYNDLPRSLQRRINETQLVMNIIEPGTPDEVMFNIFSRINTGGMALNGQEIRHALHPGPVRDYLEKLAETSEFLNATNNSIKTDRMADRECILRFLAFHIDPWERYSANDLDGYLGDAMKKINRMNSHRLDILTESFLKAMRAAFDIFGNDAFRKRYGLNEERRNPINKALLETWSVELAHRSDKEIGTLVERKQEVTNQFILLMTSDQEFEKAISISTGDPARVKKRFLEIQRLTERCL